MKTLIITKDSGSEGSRQFLSHSNKWVAEYPDAQIFTSIRFAKKWAHDWAPCWPGETVSVVEFYGYENEVETVVLRPKKKSTKPSFSVFASDGLEMPGDYPSDYNSQYQDLCNF